MEKKSDMEHFFVIDMKFVLDVLAPSLLLSNKAKLKGFQCARDCAFSQVNSRLETWKKIVMGSSFKRPVGKSRRIAGTCEGRQEGNDLLV